MHETNIAEGLGQGAFTGCRQADQDDEAAGFALIARALDTAALPGSLHESLHNGSQGDFLTAHGGILAAAITLANVRSHCFPHFCFFKKAAGRLR